MRGLAQLSTLLLATAAAAIAVTAGPARAQAPATDDKPDPATPDPATPDPATPDPATPDPATPDPATPDPATPDPATPDISLQPGLVVTGPPPAIGSFSVAGTLIDSEEIVRGLLRPVLRKYQIGWTPVAQQNVVEFLKKIGYYADISAKSLPSGELDLTIKLEPVTLVRFVKIDIDKPSLNRICEPIFADDLARRMSLRPGAQLARNKKEQSDQLRFDAERLANYLRSKGYFDAQVTVSSKSKGRYAAELKVVVTPGVGYRVGKITTVGAYTFSAKQIATVFRHRRNIFARAICPDAAVFTRARLAEDVAKVVTMYQRRGYPGVRVRTDFDMRSSFKRDTKTVELQVEIRERRRIDVHFIGNSAGFPESEIRTVLTFSEEGAYDDVEVQASAEAIARYYQTKGYFQTNVTWERYRLSSNVKQKDGRADSTERIYFYIREGPKLPVRSMQITGNKQLKTSTIRDVIETKVFRSVILAGGGGYATSVQLGQDAGRIRRLYQSRGFRDVDVGVRAAPSKDILASAPAIAAAVAADVKSSGLHVQFVIDEGLRETISRIDFLSTDANPISVTELETAVTHKAGDPLLEEKAIADGRRLEDLYFARGFPRAKITLQFDRPDDLPGQVNLIYQITSNSDATIGNIALRGNFKTRPWVILDELRIAEGQKLTLRAAERAQSNLRGSGLFSVVNVDYIGRDDLREKTVNVLVKVEERYDYRGEIEFSGGYSTDRKLFAGLKYQHRNIGGIGVRLEGSGVYGTEEQRAQAKVSIPRWIMRRAFRTALLAETSAHYINQDVERFGALRTLGVGTALTKEATNPLFRGFLLSLRYDFRQRQRDRELVRPAGASDDVTVDKIATRTSTFGPVLVVDRRRDRDGNNNPLSPSAGFLLELRTSFGENAVLGTDRFIKLGASGQYYLPIGRRLLLSNGVRYDHGFPLGGASLLPDVERYFAGGDTTVRGFEEDRLAAEIIQEDLGPFAGLTQFRVLPAGGNIRFIHNVELQFDLYEITQGINLASAIFVDTGLLTNSLNGFEIRDLRHSVGTTLIRATTPAGSLSLEWAIPLDPKLGDNPLGRIHLNVGFLF